MSNIIQDKEYIEGMIRGIKFVSAVIYPTYGGSGTNVIVESKLNPGHLVTNDAQTIVQALEFKENPEKRALALIKEMVAKTDKESGNARKTTILLADRIVTEGYIYQGDKNQLKRDLDSLISFIETKIDEQTIQITVSEISSVATTASENPETGSLLQEIYQKIGKDGIIIPESSGTYETSYEFKEGVRFDMTGFLSPYMVHDEQATKDKVKETKAIYENPLILVTKKKITTDDDINPLLNQLEMDGKKDLVIFTQDMDSGVAAMLIQLHKSKRFNILIIKNSSIWRDFVFEDFAKCVGATIIEDSTGYSSFKNLPLSILGTCGKIIVDEEETVITGTKDISHHIALLATKRDDDSKLRVSWLNNKTAILRLGSNSETDLSLKRLKCYDAIRSSQLALKYGVVRGGGLCLETVAESLPDTVAGNILRTALEYPRSVQVQNSGTEEVGENVVDSSQTQKFAIRHAIGIASTILTASSLIYLPEKTAQELASETRQSNPFGQ